MELTDISFIGPDIDSQLSVLGELPEDLGRLLQQVNGFIQFGGGLHVRGVCPNVSWHDLGSVWFGGGALHSRYSALRPTDVPFAQDCVADQFFLREGVVWKLWAETGDAESLDLRLLDFLAAAGANPVDFLGMHPLLQFQRDGGSLDPGQVLHVYPPFCTKESGKGISLKAVGCEEALAFLADFSRQLSGLPDGAPIQLRAVP